MCMGFFVSRLMRTECNWSVFGPVVQLLQKQPAQSHEHPKVRARERSAQSLDRSSRHHRGMSTSTAEQLAPGYGNRIITNISSAMNARLIASGHTSPPIRPVGKTTKKTPIETGDSRLVAATPASPLTLAFFGRG